MPYCVLQMEGSSVQVHVKLQATSGVQHWQSVGVFSRRGRIPLNHPCFLRLLK